MSADPSYGPRFHVRRSGNAVVPTGKSLDIESGGALKVAGDDVTAVLATLGVGTTLDAILAALGAADRAINVKRVALAAVDTAGGVFAWAPGFACVVGPLIIDRTTASTGACTIDAGIAANVTTLSDTLIDGLNANATAAAASSIDNKGTNGAAFRKCGASEAVTGSVASGASAGIVGFAYIPYIKV